MLFLEETIKDGRLGMSFWYECGFDRTLCSNVSNFGAARAGRRRRLLGMDDMPKRDFLLRVIQWFVFWGHGRLWTGPADSMMFLAFLAPAVSPTSCWKDRLSVISQRVHDGYHRHHYTMQEGSIYDLFWSIMSIISEVNKKSTARQTP
jgi:hypothetical protein